MSRRAILGLSVMLAACASDDGGQPSEIDNSLEDGGANSQNAGDAAPEMCLPSPYNGLEPACDFEPGPGNGATEPSALPTPAGPCPGFAPDNGCREEAGGALTCTFQPAGEPAREAKIWMSPDARTRPGPLIIYYYGLLGFPDNAVTPFAGFTAEAQSLLFAEGGILVAPLARPDRSPPMLSRLPWIGALGLEEDDGDFLLVDEIVACAIEQIGIDARRIHITGLSAGAWMTAQVGVRRSNYIASVALFSGGIEQAIVQDPSNKYPVAMFHGGPTDFVGARFQNEAQSGVHYWRNAGHFAMSCDHQGGHTVPGQAALAGMQFLLDHPYGTVRSPYCDAAPPETSFCALTMPAVPGVIPSDVPPDSAVQACIDTATADGFRSATFDDEMLTCACGRCASQLDACRADPACADILRCGAEFGCLGISCYQNHLCAPVIDAAGGAVGASAQLAVDFSDCTGAAACGQCWAP